MIAQCYLLIQTIRQTVYYYSGFLERNDRIRYTTKRFVRQTDGVKKCIGLFEPCMIDNTIYSGIKLNFTLIWTNEILVLLLPDTGQKLQQSSAGRESVIGFCSKRVSRTKVAMPPQNETQSTSRKKVKTIHHLPALGQKRLMERQRPRGFIGYGGGGGKFISENSERST